MICLTVKIRTVAAKLNHIWALLILEIEWLLMDRRIVNHRMRSTRFNCSILNRPFRLYQSFGNCQS